MTLVGNGAVCLGNINLHSKLTQSGAPTSRMKSPTPDRPRDRTERLTKLAKVSSGWKWGFT